jgi:pimeloyl-ACP methyl ester carboxylesterase
MTELELSGGTIKYEDTGGDGPVLVLLHEFMTDGSLWADEVARLAADHRCVVPALPPGAHRHGMHPDAGLSLPGLRDWLQSPSSASACPTPPFPEAIPGSDS